MKDGMLIGNATELEFRIRKTTRLKLVLIVVVNVPGALVVKCLLPHVAKIGELVCVVNLGV